MGVLPKSNKPEDRSSGNEAHILKSSMSVVLFLLNH